jgi:hypothetical protein
VIRGMDGLDFLDRALEIGGMVTSIPMVMALAVFGVRRSMETLRGRHLGQSGRRWEGSR